MKIIASNSLNSEANKVKTSINNITNNINEIKYIIQNTPSFWDGDDAKSFICKYEEVLKELDKHIENLNDYYSFMSKVKGIFDALDDSYNKSIDVS